MNFDDEMPVFVQAAVTRALNKLPEADARAVCDAVYAVTCSERLRPPDAPDEAFAACIPTNAPRQVIWVDRGQVARFVFNHPDFVTAAIASEFAHVLLGHLGKVTGEQAEREANDKVLEWGLYHPWLDENVTRWQEKDAPKVDYSLSPGHIPYTHGTWHTQDRLLLSSQSQANELAGLILSVENNEFPSLTITLATNNRFFDITPSQYIQLSVETSDTERGFSFTNKRFIPRRVRYIYEPGIDALMCEIDVEAEVSPAPAITGDTPSTPPELPLPPISPLPPIITNPGLPGDATEVWFLTGDLAQLPKKIVWSGDFFKGGQPDWNAVDVPSGLGASGSVPHTFDITADGSTAYLLSFHTADNAIRIYKTTNPRVSSPTWTTILDTGGSYETEAGWTVSDLGRLYTYGSRLICMVRGSSGVNVRHYLSEYDGASWTFRQTSLTGAFAVGHITPFYRAYGYISAGVLTVKALPSDATINTESSVLTQNTSWQNLTNGDRFMFRQTTGPTVYYVYNVTDDTSPLSGFNFGAIGALTPVLRGAHRGTQVLFVDSNGSTTGVLQKSSDGVTWTTGASWLPGIAETAHIAGGNTMVWMPYAQTNSNEMCRISSDGGTNWSAMTGDFWTNIQTDGVAFRLLNMRCVFKRDTSSGQ